MTIESSCSVLLVIKFLTKDIPHTQADDPIPKDAAGIECLSYSASDLVS